MSFPLFILFSSPISYFYNPQRLSAYALLLTSNLNIEKPVKQTDKKFLLLKVLLKLLIVQFMKCIQLTRTGCFVN